MGNSTFKKEIESTINDPLFTIDGKVAIVTGGCGLIGSTICEAFIERNCKVVICDLSESDSALLSHKLGDNCRSFPGDVSESKYAFKLLQYVIKEFGKVDILINNHQFKPKGFLEAKAETFPESLWDDIIKVNLKGTFLMCKTIGHHMIEKGGGSIINFASTYGIVSSNPALYDDNSMGNPVAYTASKGGVIALTKYLGTYWASKGVRVNAVSPHGVWNNHEEEFVSKFSSMSPMNRLSTKEEVIGAVLFLASEASSYATGSNLLIEGGWTSW